MGRAIPYDLRVKIVRARQAGVSSRQLSLELGCSEQGVGKIWHRFQSKGWEGLGTDYGRCGRRSPFADDVRGLLDSKCNGEWGAPLVVSVLMEKYPDKRIPHERTVQLWWKQQGVNRPKGRPPAKGEPFVKELHHTWQLDGKEQIPLRSGEQVTWLNLADEASSSDLYAEIFPPAKGG